MKGVYCLARTLGFAIMQCKKACGLSGKVVALNDDCRTAKTYLCNQDGTGSLFLT